MLPTALLSPILDMVGEVIDRVVPDSKEALELKNKFSIETRKLESEQLKGFRDFIVAYEGKGEAVHPVIQVLRGSVRPVLTYFLAILYAWGFLNPDEVNEQFMTGLFQLNVISLVFWYGERTLKNLGLNISNKK